MCLSTLKLVAHRHAICAAYFVTFLNSSDALYVYILYHIVNFFLFYYILGLPVIMNKMADQPWKPLSVHQKEAGRIGELSSMSDLVSSATIVTTRRYY